MRSIEINRFTNARPADILGYTYIILASGIKKRYNNTVNMRYYAALRKRTRYEYHHHLR